jgi:hypothetical protein
MSRNPLTSAICNKDMSVIVNIKAGRLMLAYVLSLVLKVAAAILCCIVLCGHVTQEHLLYGPFMMTEYRPDLIHDILARLTPDGVRCDLQSSVFGRAAAAESTTTENDATAATTDAAAMVVDTSSSNGVVVNGHSGTVVATVHVDGDIQFKSRALCQKPDASYEPSVEPHFGLQYWCNPIPVEIVETWQDAVINGQQQQQTEVCVLNLYI